MKLDEGEYLAHYGILRKSGRYPWGSGENPHQRSKTFLNIIDEHKKAGLSEAQIANLYQPRDKDGKKIAPYFTTSDLRAVKSRAINEVKQERYRTAQSLADKGMSPSAIGRQMGMNESSVRSLLAPGRQKKLDELKATADMLRRQVDEKGMIDIGAHVERDLPVFEDIPNIGISKDKFNTAISLLKEEGYNVHTFRAMQQGTGEYTKYKVLTRPEITSHDAFVNRDQLRLISEKSGDGGKTWRDTVFQKPLTINPKRIAVRYKEEGGADADGVIYVRPGVKDISLGNAHYAQVRIAVGGTHYLKGMAIYKDDLPTGVDLMFNTNKSNTGNKLDAMKPLKTDKNGDVDWNNPFGSFPKQGGQLLDEKTGKVTSVMNKLYEEGDWAKWSRSLSRQVLSKQSPELARSQLGLTYDRRQQEFEKLKALTNPLIRRKLLETFSDETDSAAVQLKAAAMPRQVNRVLLPVPSMKPTEIFAPTFKDGERVALVRFPHAGTFEIPELTVNNKNPEAKKLFGIGKGGTALDAVGIHPKVAEHLSGADFDGDAVVVIPNNRGQIQKSHPLDGLKGFDPQKYKVPTPDEDPKNGRITVTDSQKQDQMGRVTNLIADMTIRGANVDELARAVRHSMVVIDSEKHNLDYKASEKDNGILDLKRKYQGRINPNTGKLNTGASTLITRATAREDVPKRKPASVKGRPDLARTSNATIERATGRKVTELTGETNKQGQLKTFRSRKLAETDDAFTLISDHGGHEIERVYAAHSNKLKALANDARKELVATEPKPRQPSAAKVYAKEVESLTAKLNTALKNRPLERQAQVVAGHIVAQRRRANPDMDEAEKRKIKGQALEEARLRTGANKHPVDITDREWEAIQAGAISKDKLEKILQNTDIDKLRERATPVNRPVMTPAITARAKGMLASGYTYAEIADQLDIPVSTLTSSLGEGR